MLYINGKIYIRNGISMGQLMADLKGLKRAAEPLKFWQDYTELGLYGTKTILNEDYTERIVRGAS